MSGEPGSHILEEASGSKCLANCSYAFAPDQARSPCLLGLSYQARRGRMVRGKEPWLWSQTDWALVPG